jgi:uncharacterized tellurite resistance protein B-like protein
MKEQFKRLAAAVIYADGEIVPSELGLLEKLATDFGAELASVVSDINAEIEQLKPMDEDEFQQYMREAAAGLTDAESRYKLFDAMLELTLVDNELDDLETNLLGNISQYLDIPIHYFANNLAHAVKSRNVEITAQIGWVNPPEN